MRRTDRGHPGSSRPCAGRALVRAVLALGLILPPALGQAADSRTLLDGAARHVEVPPRVERVYAAGGPATIFLYALAPDALLGWTRPLTREEQAFIPAPYDGLPVLGRLTGRGNTASVEVVLAARPHVILDYGVVSPTYVALAGRIQQQTGVPYLLYDGSLSAMPRALEQAGDLLGVRERAARLARYAEGVLRDVDARLARVPSERRPRFYYARGPRGLETATKGAINVEGIERLGARNVAGERPGSPGTTVVSPEQVLGWDPEVIITIDPAFFARVRTDPVWRRRRRGKRQDRQPGPWDATPRTRARSGCSGSRSTTTGARTSPGADPAVHLEPEENSDGT